MTILVQQLRAEIEQLKAENTDLKSAKHTVECRFEVSEDTLSCIRGCLRAAEGDIDQLKAENAELRRDAERYRWLRNKSEFGTRHDPAVYKDGPTEDLDFFHGDELDAAIDQAMTKEQP